MLARVAARDEVGLIISEGYTCLGRSPIAAVVPIRTFLRLLRREGDPPGESDRAWWDEMTRDEPA